MEVYVLDGLLRRVAVIDRFESLIWTERFKELGDFELVVNSTNETRSLLAAGTRLAVNESHYVMTVETFEDHKDSEGKALLTVKGRSLESLLEGRVATDGVSPKWVLTGTPGDIARYIFDQICVQGMLSTQDIIPFMVPGNLYPTDTIAEPSASVTIEVPISTVLKATKDICDIYDLGFRLVRNLDFSQLVYNIYAGSDRTTQQTTLAPVVFSPELDNMTDVKELTSISLLKNVAYVFGKNGTEIVYANGADASTSGFDRHVLVVEANGIDNPAGPELTALLKQKGLDELAKNRSISAFDGEVAKNSPYKYGVDYFLGDLVEMRNNNGATNNMRVTEQIFVSDTQGERSYPTLAIDSFITPGSWIAWDYKQVWVDASTTWENA